MFLSDKVKSPDIYEMEMMWKTLKKVIHEQPQAICWTMEAAARE